MAWLANVHLLPRAQVHPPRRLFSSVITASVLIHATIETALGERPVKVTKGFEYTWAKTLQSYLDAPNSDNQRAASTISTSGLVR